MHTNQKIYRKCHKKCERCENSHGLLVHHIDHNRDNNEFDNFMVVCESCHALLHKRIVNIHKMKHLYLTQEMQLTFNFI